MLVQCWDCRVSYDHTLGKCVGCGAEYRPTAEEQRQQLVVEVAEWLRSGMKRTQAIRRLTTVRKVGELEAEELVQAACDQLRDSARLHGRYVVKSGLVLVLIAFGIFILTGGFLIATGCLALGGAMVVVGWVKTVTGWNITGRDEE